MSFAFKRFIALMIGLWFLSGCATLEPTAREQKVLVKSQPSGAEIYLAGKKIGITPAVIDIPRSRKTQNLELKYQNEKIVKALISDYRWRASGLSNLLWFGLAGVGWAVDLVTGTAWEVQPRVIANFKSSQEEVFTDVIALAPPQGTNEFLADDVGEELELYFSKKYPESKVIPYEMSRDIFANFDYSIFRRPLPDQQANLMSRLNEDLQVTRVFQPYFELRKDRLHVHGEVYQTDNNEAVAEHNFSFAAKNLEKYQGSLWREDFGELFVFVPNNIGLVINNSVSQLEMNGEQLNAVNKAQDGFWGEVSQVISAVTINYIEPPTRRPTWRSNYQFTPLLVFNWSDFAFEEQEINLLDDYEFSKLNFGAGIGPNWSYESKSGKFFVEFIPILTYFKLDSKKDDLEFSGEKVSITAQSQLGYSVFINDNLNLTFFIAAISENKEVWQVMIDDIAGAEDLFNLKTGQNSFAGFRLAYYFPTYENPLRKVFD